MNTCLIHSQTYPLDGFCVYCGPPSNYYTSGTGVLDHNHSCAPDSYSGAKDICAVCGRRIFTV